MTACIHLSMILSIIGAIWIRSMLYWSSTLEYTGNLISCADRQYTVKMDNKDKDIDNNGTIARLPWAAVDIVYIIYNSYTVNKKGIWNRDSCTDKVHCTEKLSCTQNTILSLTQSSCLWGSKWVFIILIAHEENRFWWLVVLGLTDLKHLLEGRSSNLRWPVYKGWFFCLLAWFSGSAW